MSLWVAPLVCTPLDSEVRGRFPAISPSPGGLSPRFRELDPSPTVEEAQAPEPRRRSCRCPLASDPVIDAIDVCLDTGRRSGTDRSA